MQERTHERRERVPAARWGRSSGPAPVLAVLIGVDVGTKLTYVGSLADLLWRRVQGPAAPTATRFSIVGLATVPLTLVAATTALWLALRI
jgi:arsenical pump membrane protein